MIKKLIGILVAVAVVVIIVVAVIRRDNFQTMELRDGIMNQTFPEPVTEDQNTPIVIEQTDTVTITVTDSL